MSRGSQLSFTSDNDVLEQNKTGMIDTFNEDDVQIMASHLLYTRRITTKDRQKERESQKTVEIKELRGYLLKKSPSFFAGWQVSSFPDSSVFF